MKHNGLMYATSAARRALLLLLVIMSASVAISCDGMRGSETRTFELKQLKPMDALALVEGYVPGGTDNIRSSTVPPALTVTAPRSRLDQVAQVLAKYDKAAPNAHLTFQIIEADGFTTTDPAIADVEGALRELFKFKGYRLLGSEMVIAHAPGHFSKVIPTAASSVVAPAGATEAQRDEIAMQVQMNSYFVTGTITSDGGADAVHLDLKLSKSISLEIETSVNVPNGQTVVVGSAPGAAGKPAIILVVRNDMK